MDELKLRKDEIEIIERLAKEAQALWVLRNQVKTIGDVIIEALQMYVNYLKKKNYYG